MFKRKEKIVKAESVAGEPVKLKAIRDGYGEALIELGKKRADVVALSGDLKESTRCEEFAKAYPERFIEVGVAEQNMALVASGMAVCGKTPFISSYAAFSPGRNWEPIRTAIAYNDANVKIAGHHAGLMTGPDGATHQSLEDIAIMRAMPNMTVIVPCDAEEARKATLAAAKYRGPAYIRFAREKTPVVTDKNTEFEIGKAIVMYDPEGRKAPEAVIIACGTMVYQAILAAQALAKEKISVVVINSHTIKPLDEEMLIKWIKKCGAVVTAEEHNIFGGLGSAVAELSAREHPVPIEFIGIKDIFGESGNSAELMEKYGLTASHIVKAAKKAIVRRY